MKVLESSFKVLALSLVLAWTTAAPAVADESAYVRQSEHEFRLGNEFLERIVTVQDGYPLTIQLENKISGRSYSVGGSEFQLELIWERLGYSGGSENPLKLNARDFKVESHRTEDGANGAKRLVFGLFNHDREPALRVSLIYEVRPGDPCTRQWMELRTEGTGSFFVHYAAVQDNDWPGNKLRLGGFGQPIFSDDLFWGLEYPSGMNRIAGQAITLGSYVGLKTPSSGFASEKAVIGVAPTGQVQQAFFSYIDKIRAQPVRPYVLYNTWYDLQRLAMADGNTQQRARELNDILQNRYKLKLDSFVLDDGWDNMKKLWQIDTTRFPEGFKALAQTLKQMGSGLGIWYGPVGGYDDREIRIATARAEGMEIESTGDLLCLAGRHYSEFFENTVLTMQKTYDMNFFKLDGVPFGCNEPDHGHPTGIYSREADERVFVDLLGKLRKQRPDIFLNITTGIWLSPWWLQYGDTVWMGGEDSGYLSTLPTLSPRQSALSYRDSVLYDDFVRQALQFPVSSIMTHGIIRGKYNELGGAAESLSDWRDELVHYVSVGNMMTELYITPELLHKQEWDDLAATLHWAQANQHPLLDNTKLVLGDPAKREPYGFVHSGDEQTLITLRNPFAEPRSVHLTLGESAGFRACNKPYRLETIYPFREAEEGEYSCGSAIDVRLNAFEQRVLRLEPVATSDLTVRGARYSVTQGAEGAGTIHVFAPLGSKRSVEVSGNQDGKHQFALKFGAAQDKVTVVTASTAVLERSRAREASLEFQLQIPSDVPRTTVALLFEPNGSPYEISAKATDNGAPVALTTQNGKGVWQWFSLVIKPGTHSLRFALNLPASSAQGGKISAWAITERQLREQTISVKLPGKSAADSPESSLPQSNEIEKTTIPLLEQSLR